MKGWRPHRIATLFGEVRVKLPRLACAGGGCGETGSGWPPHCRSTPELDQLLSVIGVGETLAALLLTEMPEPAVLRRSGEIVAYAGLNPSHHRSGTSIDRPTPRTKRL